MAKTLQLSDIPVMNFGKFMMDRMKPFGDKTALVDGFTHETYKYNDIIHRSGRLAAGLQRIGVSKGDVVCIMSPNCLDYAVVSYGVALVTAVLQPINPLYTKDDISRIILEGSTKFIITTPVFLPKVKNAILSSNSFEHIKVILFGDDEEGCISFESLLNPSYGDYTTAECDPKTTILSLLSSSGTTGFPKSTCLSHYSTIANMLQILDSCPTADNCILYVPMFHLYGIYTLLALNNAIGYRIIIMNKFDPETYLQLIQTYKPSYLHTVPPIMVMLAKHPKVAVYDLSSVKDIACGAAPLSEEIETAVLKKLNLEHITQGYGMTETGVTHANTKTDFKHKSVGKLVPLADVKEVYMIFTDLRKVMFTDAEGGGENHFSRIVDVDSGKTLGPDEEGEIWLRGPQTTLGYLNLPQQTKDMFLEDGWVRTGDIGKEDGDGFLFVVDRLKELIKYKGYQVAPATLEDILLRHDAVADVGVIGLPDEDAGELPRSFVVKKAGHEVTEAELQAFVAELVAPHMKLRGGAEFVTEIPRTASGKIMRRVLRERASGQKEIRQ